MSRSGFDRSGIAALSDLDTPEWRTLFAALEARQRDFVERESQFRSADYRWPRRPLHMWSRVWEYPYAYHQLTRHRATLPEDALPLAVDVGSGVTFFPFAVADLGYRVVCTDVDPVCAGDLARAVAALPTRRGRVEPFRQTDGTRLPFDDGEVDAVYCVSVLEHIPTWAHTLDEMCRVLKPGGLLILTVDLDLLGISELSPRDHRALVEQVEARFDYAAPPHTVHPSDMLLSNTGPYPLQQPEGLRRAWFFAKQRIKPLLGRKPVSMPGGVHLAVHGLTLSKRPG